MPCSTLATALEPPLAPPTYPINPQMTGAQAYIMRQAQLDHMTLQQRYYQQLQQQRSLELHRQAINGHVARGILVPSSAGIPGVMTNLSTPRPQMSSIHPRALDHYRVLLSRGKSPAAALRNRPNTLMSRVRARAPVRRSSRGLVCMNPVIGKIKEANPGRNSSEISQVYREVGDEVKEPSESGINASSEGRSFKRRRLDTGETSRKENEFFDMT
ncbi:hypothetical protein TWF506_003261 [Arthrobotrys conoides]|uniref:Uncharacterized protein n=1 Tax=Arthrobotrys conoides TaxID=74498 RepID=A0AAN8NN41_9PEZI